MVVVDDAAQHIATANWAVDRRKCGCFRNLLLQPLMRTSPVVVHHKFAHHPTQMTFAQHQNRVQTLFAYRPNPPFRKSIRIRRSVRRVDDLDPLRITQSICEAISQPMFPLFP